MRITTPALCLLFIMSAAFAGKDEMRISKSITRVDEFKEAQDEARKKSRPIVVVYSDEATKDEGVINATEKIIKTLKPISALVFANKEQYGDLPEDVRTAFNMAKGKGFPKTVIVYPNLFDTVAVLPPVTDKKKLEEVLKIAKDRTKAATEKMKADAAKKKAARDKLDEEIRRRLGP